MLSLAGVSMVFKLGDLRALLAEECLTLYEDFTFGSID
jgi:hypothetical protein